MADRQSDGVEPRRTKGERTRARLIEVAASCFSEFGYRATTFDQLVAASGLSRGAVHFHFKTKEDLAVAVLTSRQDEWLRQVQDESANLPDAAAILADLAPTLLRLHADDPTGWTTSVISNELALVPSLAPLAATVAERWIEWLVEVIERGQSEGSVRSDLDPASVATVLFASMDGLRQTTDLLESPRSRRAAFRRHVETLSALVQHGFLDAETQRRP